MPDDRHHAPPPCPCGARAWDGRGGSFSVLLGQWHHVCRSCNCYATEIHAPGGNLFVIPPSPQNDGALNYLNRVVLPFWTEREGAIKAARAVLAEQVRPAINAALGLPLAAKHADVPEHLLDAWRVAWDAFDARPDVRRPAGFERVPDPPEWPEGVVGYVERTNGWERIGGTDAH